MTKRELDLGRLLFPTDELAPKRPKTRGECEAARGHNDDGKPNPCPFVSCRYHLALDVNPKTGAIREVFPDLDMNFALMPETCVLDAADRGGMTLEDVGELRNLTRERIRQQEVVAMAKMAAVGETYALRDLVEDGGPVGKRRLPMLRAVPKPEPIDELDDEPENDEAPAIVEEPDFDCDEVTLRGNAVQDSLSIVWSTRPLVTE